MLLMLIGGVLGRGVRFLRFGWIVFVGKREHLSDFSSKWQYVVR